MFTGIVETVGVLRAVDAFGDGRQLEVEAPSLGGLLEPGESVSIDGACHTVITPLDDGFTVQSIATTLGRTIVGDYQVGRRVNLERALGLGERLGGHLVQGHVDGIGEVLRLEDRGEHVLVDISLPLDLAEITIPHGSIAVNGVSMTVNALPEDGSVQISVIPFTWRHTNFADLRPGDRVNLEGDMIGKFVRQLVHSSGGAAAYRDRSAS